MRASIRFAHPRNDGLRKWVCLRIETASDLGKRPDLIHLRALSHPFRGGNGAKANRIESSGRRDVARPGEWGR